MDNQNKQDRQNDEADSSATESVEPRSEMFSDDEATSSEENVEVRTWAQQDDGEDNSIALTFSEQNAPTGTREGRLQNNERERPDDTQVENSELTEFRSDFSSHDIPGSNELPGSVEKCRDKKNEELHPEMCPEESQDDDSVDTSSEEDIEAQQRAQEEQLQNMRQRSSQYYTRLTNFRPDPMLNETPRSNSFLDHLSRERVEQAMMRLRLAENYQENGQYNEALSCCEAALQTLRLSDDINLYLKFCSNIMQLHYVMENIDEAINTFYDRCSGVLDDLRESIDPKIIMTITDLYSLCFQKF